MAGNFHNVMLVYALEKYSNLIISCGYLVTAGLVVSNTIRFIIKAGRSWVHIGSFFVCTLESVSNETLLGLHNLFFNPNAYALGKLGLEKWLHNPTRVLCFI